MNVDQGVFSSLLSKRGGSMEDVDADRRLDEAEVVEEKDSFDFALEEIVRYRVVESTTFDSQAKHNQP